MQFWIDTYDVLKNEPVEGINPMILTQLRDLGITKSGGAIIPVKRYSSSVLRVLAGFEALSEDTNVDYAALRR